jgi:hypothetical protein
MSKHKLRVKFLFKKKVHGIFCFAVGYELGNYRGRVILFLMSKNGIGVSQKPHSYLYQ